MVSRLEAGDWTCPAPVAFLASVKAFEPHVTLDNKRLHFNGDIPAPAGEAQRPGLRIYAAERTSTDWSEPKYAGEGMFISSSRDGSLYTTHLNAFPNCDHVSRAVMENGRLARAHELQVATVRSQLDRV